MYATIKNLLDSTLECDTILNIPKDFKMGHFATPMAFTLAKKLRKNPNEIAQNIKEKLANLPTFSNIEVVNGYVNFHLSDEFLAKMAGEILERGDFRGELKGESSESNSKDSADLAHKCGESKNPKCEHILLEFVSANPTGPLHIGHARGAIWGDTMARIGRFLGHKITSEYYINDAGSQIENLVNSILCADIVGESKGESTSESKSESNLESTSDSPESQNLYKGAYIIDLAKDAKVHFGDDFAKTPKLRDFCINQMMDLIKSNLKSANIEFDNFVSEKSLIPALNATLEKLKANNALYENDGKVWLKSTQFGDEKDRVIIRENGEPTYLAGDIVYHNDKFSRGFDQYINIWGADHHGYIARIKASVEFLGFSSNKLEVLLSQMVSLLKDGQPYKMSKRAGNFILMSEVIDEIGIDALRFVFLTKRADTHLEFDIADLNAQDSTNPIFYINYANARIHTLLSKSNAEANFDIAPLQDEWKDVLFYALLLPNILEGAFNERAMQKLPEYLKNLASKLHFCYNTFKIIDSPNEGAICGILRIVSLSITTGLSLMGIVAKTKM